ncbi:rod shape-determining protein MreC [Altererythrobacter sp. Root672]|uniref:rod shape-determining protein MreC n=1 Tax=Altererythrobacter sp. Root672 TaxID=1736584 RepID=UPI0006F491F9|nr:rod shape-determining protein MreC [Altererythrobacter sp. Root672]KRA84618.1 rod shape-determining protein MreC [Altererythrobacter sp. Root672]
MAPPSSRRSGSNKKAQLGLFTGYVLAGVGILVGAALLAISLLRPETFNGLRSMASDAAAPVGEVGAAGRTGGKNVFEAVAGYYRAGSRNAKLEEEAKIARVKLAEAEALRQENVRLKAALRMAEGDIKPVATARLIGSTSSSARRIAYISAGTSDGVQPGMPVTSPMGLVGRVVEAGTMSSRVLLLTDSESMVPVRRATDNVVAFAEGRSDGSLRLRLVNLGVNPIKKGDVFVTSGAGGLFRPGIAVALATEITRDGAIAQLLSNPAATDVVLVEPVWQQKAIEAADRLEEKAARED